MACIAIPWLLESLIERGSRTHKSVLIDSSWLFPTSHKKSFQEESQRITVESTSHVTVAEIGSLRKI